MPGLDPAGPFGASAQEGRDVDVVVGDLERRALPVVHRDVAVAPGRSRLLARGARPRAPVVEPVAISVTRMSSPRFSSMTAPKMMLALASAAEWMISAASLTSKRPRSRRR
jgi:hypothetical protein